ncbi:MAG: class I SAM-dependent methyltransferase [Ktedonobacteraceae bacterium]|nr:class I SAM-dependent methyltransferase [Ktedonobacteraceae bacterium]
MKPIARQWLFETLYKNRYLYRFASTVPFAGQWRVWQRLVIPRIYGKDVLELGCGLGDLQADMLEAGYTCQAIEHSPEMVSAARATLKKRKVGTETQIMQGSAQHLPFDAETFDTIVSTFPSEYIYDPATISEVKRVLRPGGRVIVIEGANLLPVGFVQPFLVGIQAVVYGPNAVFGPRKQHNLDEEIGRSKQHGLDTDAIAEVVPDAWFGRQIPLEQHGLQRRSERVRSARWEVYITIGENEHK